MNRLGFVAAGAVIIGAAYFGLGLDRGAGLFGPGEPAGPEVCEEVEALILTDIQPLRVRGPGMSSGRPRGVIGYMAETGDGRLLQVRAGEARLEEGATVRVRVLCDEAGEALEWAELAGG